MKAETEVAIFSQPSSHRKGYIVPFHSSHEPSACRLTSERSIILNQI